MQTVESIPSSVRRQLRTEAVGLASELTTAEALPEGDPRRVPVGASLLGRAEVAGDFVPIPLGAFDRVAPRLRIGEQAAYFHFLRLSYGVGRDFCRVPRRDLAARLQVSERRLNETLDRLTACGCILAVHRDNRGTLYRVFSPGEVLGEAEPGLRRGEALANHLSHIPTHDE